MCVSLSPNPSSLPLPTKRPGKKKNVIRPILTVCSPHSRNVDDAHGAPRAPPRIGRQLPATDPPQRRPTRRVPPLARFRHPTRHRVRQGRGKRLGRDHDLPRRGAETLARGASRSRCSCCRGSRVGGGGVADRDDGAVDRSCPPIPCFEDEDVQRVGASETGPVRFDARSST